jgi:flagellar biosynthesis protein FliR
VDLFVSSYVALFARVLGVVIGIPFGDTVARIPRVMIAAGVTVAIADNIEPMRLPLFTVPVELLIGYILAAPVRLAVESSQMFGELLDTARGQTVGSVLDPLGSGAASDLAVIARISSLAWALHIGGVEAIVRMLIAGLDVYPPGGGTMGIAATLVSFETRALAVFAGAAFRLGVVWCVGYLMIELLCAFCAQVVGKLSCSTAGQILKALFTYIVLLLLVHDILAFPVEWLRAWY